MNSFSKHNTVTSFGKSLTDKYTTPVANESSDYSLLLNTIYCLVIKCYLVSLVITDLQVIYRLLQTIKSTLLTSGQNNHRVD